MKRAYPVTLALAALIVLSQPQPSWADDITGDLPSAVAVVVDAGIPPDRTPIQCAVHAVVPYPKADGSGINGIAAADCADASVLVCLEGRIQSEAGVMGLWTDAGSTASKSGYNTNTSPIFVTASASDPNLAFTLVATFGAARYTFENPLNMNVALPPNCRYGASRSFSCYVRSAPILYP